MAISPDVFCQTTVDAPSDTVWARAMTEGRPEVLADRYRLTDSIGRGGMADVYSAEDTQSGRMVAVKVMRVGEAADPDRFVAEMSILERLSHPAIVRLFDTGRTPDDSPYFVMQLVEGESLSTRLREEGPQAESDVVRIAARVAGALAHAHDRGVVHRDIKPANILIDESGDGYLTDFGVARLVDATLVTRQGTTIGTAAYLAPEQLQDSAVGPAADVYSLGLVLIEAFTGRRAFSGTGVEAAMARLGRDPAVPEDMPDNWIGLLLAMTRRDPARRPTAAFVEQVLRGQVPPPPLDPLELTARSTASAIASDELPTAVTPTADPSSPSPWDPPSDDSGARHRVPPPTPPPGAPPPDLADDVTSGEQPTAAGSRWDVRAVLVALVAGVLGLALVAAIALAAMALLRDDDGDPVRGDEPVDEATREVLRVLEASETLRATDPSLQRRLRTLSLRLVESVNEDRWERALQSAGEMTAEVRDGIDRLDITDVALRPLLDALQGVTREIQVEIGGS